LLVEIFVYRLLLVNFDLVVKLSFLIKYFPVLNCMTFWVFHTY